MAKILAIDPGSEQSAYVLWNSLERTIEAKGIVPNRTMLQLIDVGIGVRAEVCVLELVGHYGTGQPVGKDIFHTCIWFGQFQRTWESHSEWKGSVSNPAIWILRKTVAGNLCRNARANDAQVRQALIDRFGPGREKAVGTKKNPGPLYGVKKDIWSALALAVTYEDLYLKKGE